MNLIMQRRSLISFTFVLLFCTHGYSQTSMYKNSDMAEQTRFQPEIGTGISFVPLRSLWASSENMGLVQVGILGHISVRIHPHIDLELSGGMIPTLYNTFSSYFTYEAPFLFTTRFYVRKRAPIPKRFHLSPYLTISVGGNLTQLIDQNSTPLEQALYFETHVGGGVEVHIQPRLSLFAELTALGNVRFIPASEPWIHQPLGDKPSLATGRAGGQLRLGIMSYF